jgi:TRAP transporter TAXI family solute receptor
MKKIISSLASVLLIFVASFSLTSVAKSAEYFSIGTGGPTGVYFQVGNAICKMVAKIQSAEHGRKKGTDKALRCSAPSTGGSTYNIGQIMEGELQFGVAQSDWQYHAYNGTNPDKVKPFDGLRAVFSAHPEPFHIIARKGSKIKDWNSLKGKKVNIGNPGSGQRGTFEVLMESHGVDTSFFGGTSELTSSEQSGALCDKKIDAFGYTVGVPNSGVAQSTDGCGAYIIDLQTDAVKKLVADNPFYAWATIPKGTYKTSKKDVTTFGVMASFVTSADVSDELVYAVVKAVFENLDDFRKQHPAFANLDPKKMIVDGLSAPLHPGAIKYYKEAGLM